MRMSSESRKLTLGMVKASVRRAASLIHRKPRSRRSRGTIRLYDVRVGKVVPPNREILRTSHSFFSCAKIGVLGLNGSGKSSLLRIMAGIDSYREARPQAELKIGYLAQEPELMKAKMCAVTLKMASVNQRYH